MTQPAYEIYEGIGAWPAPANDNVAKYDWPMPPSRWQDHYPLATQSFAPLASLDDHLPGRQGRYIRTATGRRFYPHDPRPEDIFPEDIAHALGRIQRYGGHASKTYSVAEHCCLGADHVELFHGRIVALAFLLHDAAEALGMGDVAAPAKYRLPDYKEAEDRIAAAVERRFLSGFAPGRLRHPAVKEADARITTDEMMSVMHGREPDMLEPLGVAIKNWDARLAQYEWMARFKRLYQAVHRRAWAA